MRYLFIAGALLAGCAAAPESDCRTGDWYALGERDARFGQRPLIERYSAECARFGVRPPEADYLAGWAEGYSKWTGFRQPN